MSARGPHALPQRPAASVLGQWCAQPTFWDAYAVPLRTAQTPVDVFVAVFGHLTLVMKLGLLLRNVVARWFGLAVPPASTLLRPVQARACAAGDVLGPWPVFMSTAQELVLGRDNPHLDFRVSILIEGGQVVVSTVCRAHGRPGRVYLRLVEPFHTWGMKTLVRQAVRRL